MLKFGESPELGLGTFRLVLALCVVASHTYGYDFVSYPDSGIIAVVSFFFISGYLIPATFEANYRGRSFIARCGRFCINRILRIYPLYWLALGLAVLAIFIEGKQIDYDFSFRTILQNVLLLGLNQERFWGGDSKFVGPAWTLDIELQFYFLVPFFFLLKNRFPKLFFLLLLISSMAGVWLLLHPQGTKSIDQSLLPYAVFFSLGMIAYHFRSWLPRIHLTKLYRGTIGILLIGCLLFSREPFTLQWIIAGLSMVFAVGMLCKSTCPLDKYLGDLSYPVFIFHAPILLFINHAELPFFALLLMNIVVSLIAALVAHTLTAKWIDSLRLRNKTISKSNATGVPLSS